MPVTVRRRLVRWGNSLGIRVTKKEAERLGVRAGDPIDVELFGPPREEDIERLAIFRFGGDYDIDELIEEDLDGDH